METLTEAEQAIVDDFCRNLALKLRSIFEAHLEEPSHPLPEVMPDPLTDASHSHEITDLDSI